MVHYKRNYLEQVRKKKKDPEAKYAIYGYFLALQYQAYKAIDKVASKYMTTYHGIQNPRILCGSSDKALSTKELGKLFKRNNVNIFFLIIWITSSFIF